MHNVSQHRIWWIASYPKSGNTWTRILLTNYLCNGDRPIDINDLDVCLASARDVFDEHVGVEASDLTQEEIDRYRPAAYEEAARRATRPLYVKVHDAFVRNPDGSPLFPVSASAGVLYLIRNPLDVAVSFADHEAVPVERAVGWMSDPECSLASDPAEIKMQLRQRLRTWSGHVTSWVDGHDLPLLVVRYEDLKTDTVGTFTAVIQFLRLEEDEERISKAVAFSRFEQLQEQERARGFRERMPLPGQFFRQGVAGAWRKQLPPHLAAKVISDHADVMRRFGYLSPSGQPIG
jgi:sulfotransferase family protein